MPAPKPTQPEPAETVVVQGAFGDEPKAAESVQTEAPKGQETPSEVSAVHTRSISRNTTYSARSQDVLLALQLELRRRGLESPLEPFGIADLVEFAIEGIAHRIASGTAWDKVLAAVSERRGRKKDTKEAKPRTRGRAAKS